MQSRVLQAEQKKAMERRTELEAKRKTSVESVPSLKTAERNVKEEEEEEARLREVEKELRAKKAEEKKREREAASQRYYSILLIPRIFTDSTSQGCCLSRVGHFSVADTRL